MDDLIPRLRERAADPKRRTDAPQSVSLGGPGGTLTTQVGDLGSMLGGAGGAGGLSLGGLLSDLRRVVDANQAGRPIDADITRRVDAMTAGMSSDNSTSLPPPADPARLDSLEARLGARFPEELRRVWTGVADGGFGPGGGLLPAERAVTEWVALTAVPQGPKDQPWPRELLPIGVIDPGYTCIDLETGRIVDWDPQELTERSGDKAWKASFSEVASSLAAWLGAWGDARPQHEVIQEQLEDSMVRDARAARAAIAAMTPEQRAAMGLPEVGWERVVWGGIGLDDEEPSGT